VQNMIGPKRTSAYHQTKAVEARNPPRAVTSGDAKDAMLTIAANYDLLAEATQRGWTRLAWIRRDQERRARYGGRTLCLCRLD
jgi:hypothetical protein